MSNYTDHNPYRKAARDRESRVFALALCDLRNTAVAERKAWESYWSDLQTTWADHVASTINLHRLSAVSQVANSYNTTNHDVRKDGERNAA